MQKIILRGSDWMPAAPPKDSKTHSPVRSSSRGPGEELHTKVRRVTMTLGTLGSGE